VGSYLGKRKLCPNISPHKTIEGSLGGLGANLLIGSLVKHLYFAEMSWVLCIVMFLCIGFVGQVGDLFASVLKRSADIKDSGSLLPGHGGILDRIDALMFAAPVAFLFREYIL
jgi:phosphatidate cytidylyltransferase